MHIAGKLISLSLNCNPAIYLQSNEERESKELLKKLLISMPCIQLNWINYAIESQAMKVF